MFSSAVVLLVVENLSCVTETGIYPVKSRDAIAKVIQMGGLLPICMEGFKHCTGNRELNLSV